jgi:hypothetical protein
MKRPLVCRVCLERDGVESASVVEHRCTNEHTGKDFTAHVCARCLEVGHETRVTCRTFVPIQRIGGAMQLPSIVGGRPLLLW